MKDPTDTRLFADLLESESLSARLEAIFLVDPDIGRLWRSTAALTECCRSVSLEDIHVLEGDLVAKETDNRSSAPETSRGVEAARRMHAFIAQPGSLSKDPERALRRVLGASASVLGDMSDIDLVGAGEAIKDATQSSRSPILSALRAALVFRAYTFSRAPSADRMIFMAAEHDARLGKVGSLTSNEDWMFEAVNANWICLPATSLTSAKFSICSPSNPQGRHALLVAIKEQLSMAIGSIPILTRWRGSMIAKSNMTGSTRMKDLMMAFAHSPILTLSSAKAMMNVSERSALNILSHAADAGLAVCITPRDRYRAWAPPFLAERLQARQRKPSFVRATALKESIEVNVDDRKPEIKSEHLQREISQSVLKDLDDALSHLDDVLAKYGNRT